LTGRSLGGLRPSPPPTPTHLPYTTLFRSSSSPRMFRANFRVRAPLRPASTTPLRLKATPLHRLSTPSRVSPPAPTRMADPINARSEEHTSELQSREKHVCRLLLETQKQY